MLLRVNVPGQPVRYLDLGPARGRLSAAVGAPLGGPFEYGTPRKKPQPYVRVETPKPRPYQGPRCGASMRGGVCGRRLHRDDEHRTAEAVVRDNERRRARAEARKA